MRLSADPFFLPKAGYGIGEYEDAYAPHQRSISAEHACARFAVADGATDSVFAKAWAKIITGAFIKGRLNPLDIQSCLPRLSKAWLHLVTKPGLPWYVEEKLQYGAFAALVGLTLNDKIPEEDAGRWHAIAVGDSCLFHVRDEALLASFPLESSGSFNNRPYLISTRTAKPEDIAAHVKLAEGEWQEGDTFYLMTDALACYVLREAESGQRPWKTMLNLSSGRTDDFEAWIKKLRANDGLRNDDVTLYRIEIEH
jgi:hypothetical protein